MTKQWILTILVLFGTSLAQAGFKANDFNQMIRENQRVERELQNKLQKEAGIELNQDEPGTIAREKVQAPQEVEQVAVSSSGEVWQQKDASAEKEQFNKNMKRISQELEAAE